MMDENTKNNIFYRPDLEIERNYYSEGEFTTPQREAERYTPPETEKMRLHETMKETRDQLLSIRKVLTLLPLTLPEILNNIVETLILLTELNILELERNIIAQQTNVDYYPELNNNLPERQEIIVNVETDEFDEEETQTFVISEYNGKTLDIEIEKAESIDVQCRNQYLMDLTDLTNNYSVKLNSVLQSYLYPVFDILNTTGLDAIDYLNYEYDGSSVTGITTELKHVNDRIVTQDIITDELDGMFSKTHNTLKLKNVLEAFDVAECFRERYYKEDYRLKISNCLELYQNTSLEEARRKSEEAYNQCKANVYNFLDSSVKMTEDICTRKLDSEQAKALLLMNDINIYAHKEYETTGVENAETKNTAKIVTGTGAPVLTDSEYPGNQAQSASNSTSGTTNTETSKSDNPAANSSSGGSLTDILKGAVGSSNTSTNASGGISINILDIKGSMNSIANNIVTTVTSPINKGVEVINTTINQSINKVNTNINNEIQKGTTIINNEITKGANIINNEVTKGTTAVVNEINKTTNNINKEISKGTQTVSDATVKVANNAVAKSTKVAAVAAALEEANKKLESSKAEQVKTTTKATSENKK